MHLGATVVVVLWGVFERSSCLSTGAPGAACSDMVPKHGVDAQNTPPPYAITAKPSGNRFDVTLEGIGGESFRGFLIRVVSIGSDIAYVQGAFTISAAAASTQKHLNCDAAARGAVTHTSNTEKTKIETAWHAALGEKGPVMFMATVVKTKQEFWTNVKSAEVALPETVASSDSYAGCGLTSGCIGLPADCLQQQQCTALLRFSSHDKGVTFSLFRKVPDSGRAWVAAGVSHEKGMGPAHVVECFVDEGKAEMRESYNNDRTQNAVVQEHTEGISFVAITSADDTLQCSWMRTSVTTFKGLTFDLKTERVILLLAMGLLKEGTKDKEMHTHRMYTREPVNLTRPASVVTQGPNVVLLKCHGTLMIVAWFVLATLGMMVARHYKPVWKPGKLCGVDVWFVIHRIAMVSTVLVQLGAFVAVYVYLDKTLKWTTPHTVFGFTTIALSLLQVLVALLRPGHGAPWRPAFNCVHYTLANALYAFSVMAATLATGVQDSNLAGNTAYLLFIVVSVLLFFATNSLLAVFPAPEPTESSTPPEDAVHKAGAPESTKAGAPESPKAGSVPSGHDVGPAGNYWLRTLMGYECGAVLLAMLLIVCIWTAS